jgi:hypothetical protein
MGKNFGRARLLPSLEMGKNFGRARLLPSLELRLGRSLALPKKADCVGIHGHHDFQGFARA